MGCCELDPISLKKKYKESDKGISKLHEHMLIYSNIYWKEYNDDESFICNQCNDKISSNGCFLCRKCNYALCSKCFYSSKGKIANDFQTNKKGQINDHKHILTCRDIHSRNIPLAFNPTYKCHICGAIFLMDTVESWNCPKCGYDICDKCFKENKGIIVT